MAIAQIGMLSATLAILVYIAIIVSGYVALEQTPQYQLGQEVQTDSSIRDEMINNVDYVHKADISRSSFTTLLNGITLHDQDFILLFDSTPYASRGHVALLLPCDENTPEQSLFRILIGRAPQLAPLPLGYLDDISNPPRSCVYHGQFGFGDPVTDIALQNIAGTDIVLEGPHSVTITTHESFLPREPGEKEIQHEQ